MSEGAKINADWHDALTRRLRSLLKTGPLHDLRSSESRQGALMGHDDTIGLCMKALEVLIDSMGVRPGAEKQELAEALFPLLEAGDTFNEVSPDKERHEKVVDIILGVLLNSKGRNQAYSAEYIDFVDGKPVRRTLRFLLASEHETFDGKVVIKAQPDGVNLFLRSLDVELEDAQAATEAVMRSQIERGRLDLALQSSREAQIRSIQYHEKVHTLIRKTRRDVNGVDWKSDVPKLLQEALEHLDDRLKTERDMRTTAGENMRKILGTEEAHVLARICDVLDDCFQRHLELQSSLMQAFEIFRREQERQRFAPRPLMPLPDLESEILLPLLENVYGESEPLCSSFARGIFPAVPPVLMDLSQLWNRLLKPPPDRNDLGPALDEHELDDLLPPAPIFNENLTDKVDRRLSELQEPTLLSDLLEQTTDDSEARFLVLRALQHYAPGNSRILPLVVEKSCGVFELPKFSGDSILVLPSENSEIEVCHG